MTTLEIALPIACLILAGVAYYFGLMMETLGHHSRAWHDEYLKLEARMNKDKEPTP